MDNIEKPINPNVEAERLLLKVIPKTNHKDHVWSVGGFVRDTILGIEPNDLDVVVDVKDGAEALTRSLHSIFSAETYPPRQMGAHYPIWQLVFKKDVANHFSDPTGVYKVEGAEIEFSDTMVESYPDGDSRQREVAFGTIREDVFRRDFTINSLMRDLTTGEICDFCGDAKYDIEHRLIRALPGVIPDKMFSEDPLRLLRAIRFSITLEALTGQEWTIPLYMLKSMRGNSHRIDIISAERVRAELEKIMVVGGLWKALKLMRAVCLLEHVFPEVDAMIGCFQPEKFHGEGDVWEHIIETLKHANPGVLDQMAAMLHDVGKPSTRTTEGDETHFYKHEWVGSDMAVKIMERLKFDRKAIEEVSYVVKWHMRPHSLSNASKTALRRFLRETPERLIKPLLDVAEADERGSIPDLKLIPKLRERLFDPELNKIPIKRKPVLDGFEIMEALGIDPGPMIGKVGEWLMELEDEYGAEGKILTKEAAKDKIIVV